MTSGPLNSDGQQTQERLFSVKEELHKNAFWNTRSIQELIGKHDASANVSSLISSNVRSATKRPRKDSDDVSMSERRNKSASAHINSAGQQTQYEKVSRRVRIGSTMNLYKRLAIRKRSKELSSPHSLLEVGSTFQHKGKEDSMMRTCTQRDLSLDATYEEHLAKVIYERDILFDEELTNDMCQVNRNGSVSTDHAAIQVAKCNQLMDAPMLSLDRPTQQGRENYENAGSSQSTVDGSSQSTVDDNSNLRRCSTPSPSTAPISSHPVPFVKNSHACPVVEASDVFKLVPQQPHFLPLREHPLEIREGMALGLMVSFASLVGNIRKASIEESMEFFENKINTLCHFEHYGFNVEFLQSSLTKMLQIKSNRSKYLEEINKLKEEMVGKTTSLPGMSASLNQKQKIISELEQQLAQLCPEAQQFKKDREHENAKLSRLESMRSRFEEACGEGESQFRNILDDLHRERQWSLEDVPLLVPDDVIGFFDSKGGLDYSGGPYSLLAAPTVNTTSGSSPIDCTGMAGNGYAFGYSRAPPVAGTAIAAAPSINEAMVGIPYHGDENRSVAELAEADIGVGNQQASSSAGDDVQPMIVQEYFPAASGPSQPNNANEEQEQQEEVRPMVRSKYQIQKGCTDDTLDRETLSCEVKAGRTMSPNYEGKHRQSNAGRVPSCEKYLLQESRKRKTEVPVVWGSKSHCVIDRRNDVYNEHTNKDSNFEHGSEIFKIRLTANLLNKAQEKDHLDALAKLDEISIDVVPVDSLAGNEDNALAGKADGSVAARKPREKRLKVRVSGPEFVDLMRHPEVPDSGGGGTVVSSSSSVSAVASSSVYESRKRKDWKMFEKYLRDHRPLLSLAQCSGVQVLEFLRYLDQYGKTKVHTGACPYFGHPAPPASCPCLLR